MPFLSEPEQFALLQLARRSIEEAVSRDTVLEDIPQMGIFAQPAGAFVTIHVRGRLRGCIGVVEAVEPLGECVVHCAASAARQDPRFSPVESFELAEMTLEISLLSPPEAIRPDEIQVGYHGLLVAEGSRRGLLLPQVALEHQLTREQFLEETCRKAGLPLDAWTKPETKIFAFTCEIVSEPRKPPA